MDAMRQMSFLPGAEEKLQALNADLLDAAVDEFLEDSKAGSVVEALDRMEQDNVPLFACDVLAMLTMLKRVPGTFWRRMKLRSSQRGAPELVLRLVAEHETAQGEREEV